VKNVYRQQLRPGSGHLIIRTISDGPTRVLQISNIKNKSYLSINWEKTTESNHAANMDSPTNQASSTSSASKISKSLEVYVNLTGGIGVSLIQWLNQEYEELVYACLKSLEVTFDQTSVEQKLTVGIQSIQICNQLINAFKQNLLCIQTAPFGSLNVNTTSSSSGSSASASLTSSGNNNQLVKSGHDVLLLNKKQMALEIDFLRKFRNMDGPVYIEHLLINLDDVNLQIEERLLWKLIQFFGVKKLDRQGSEIGGGHETKASRLANDPPSSSSSSALSSAAPGSNSQIEAESSLIATNSYYKHQIASIIADSQAIKYSFNKLQVNSVNMTLSVNKTSKLSMDLVRIKSTLGIPLIQFENARIECKPFILMNEHDTALCILNLIRKHYTQELRSNAIRILGSVDFLGNPLGLMVDFKESLTNILSNGQVDF
jgi:vacuolar protein sorting-associated protein 13D